MPVAHFYFSDLHLIDAWLTSSGYYPKVSYFLFLLLQNFSFLISHFNPFYLSFFPFPALPRTFPSHTTFLALF